MWFASPRTLLLTLNPSIPQHWLFLNPGCWIKGCWLLAVGCWFAAIPPWRRRRLHFWTPLRQPLSAVAESAAAG
ncbi:MAG: hypothetical protein FJ083_18050 [Cyanobacteria bacterium K_Offshore_surface_m2_239]|nr:hypothetical protein [Cyanobacteria bacterium K_Offshore_surface_m2_239]